MMNKHGIIFENNKKNQNGDKFSCECIKKILHKEFPVFLNHEIIGNCTLYHQDDRTMYSMVICDEERSEFIREFCDVQPSGYVGDFEEKNGVKIIKDFYITGFNLVLGSK